ncbi:MAG: arylsulfatase [Gemmataceae bacterium]|nr:arylsulfatase [Gemmata sp.]MDW8198018.1 arylsulfatase [Gemmataceae bacterium]
MRGLFALTVAFLVFTLLGGPRMAVAAPPNVLLVITDDQGFGELGVHGNPVVHTPRLDAFAKESVGVKNFYVCPVCSPTRSSLLTGLYHYRTGIVDTAYGRSLMRSDVVTLANYLANAGYRTGLFGKWHLGDNYPLRPEDRGFQETLWHHGGGLAQPSDHPDLDPATAYFNPILIRNGQEIRTRGYCTDIFTDAAVKFITQKSEKPFFAYVAYNCPHAPFQVPDEYANRYHKLDLSAKAFPNFGQPWATQKLDTDAIARAYGMIENIDTNFGRLLQALEDQNIAQNTVVIFLTDNGVGGVRWNAGLRQRKGSVYEGGIRVPFYIRWPAKFPGRRTIDIPLAHIDVTPTILDAAGVKATTSFDGSSFLRLLGGDTSWPERTVFIQWHRGDEPEKFRCFAARGPRYKLVQPNTITERAKWTPKYELFDLISDPYEQNDLAAEKPEVVAELKKQYEQWFADVTKKGFAPPRIILGSEKQNPVRLTRQDWRGPNATWAPDAQGSWAVTVQRSGHYRVTLYTRGEFDAYELTGTRGTIVSQTLTSAPLTGKVTFETPLTAGDDTLQATVKLKNASRGPLHVVIEYLDSAKK